jgi:hypothetical protein
MRHCWSADPANRPTFEHLGTEFSGLIPTEALVAMRAEAMGEKLKYSQVTRLQNNGYLTIVSSSEESNKTDLQYLTMSSGSSENRDLLLQTSF